MFSSIVVGTDGSATATAAVRQAVDMAKAVGAKLELVSAYAPVPKQRLREQRADLIIVGNKGMTGAKRFLLGSVPDKVSHHAPCSVLIIRTT